MDDAFLARFRERSAYEAGRDGPPDGFPKLPDLPLGRYTDPGFQALLERRKGEEGRGRLVHVSTPSRGVADRGTAHVTVRPVIAWSTPPAHVDLVTTAR